MMDESNVSVPGIILLFLLHATALWFLSRSRYGKKKTAALCLMCAALQGVATLVSASLMRYGQAWILTTFAAALALLVVFFFVITAENVPKTLFVILCYAQMFMAITFLAGVIACRLLGGGHSASVALRTVIHAAMIGFYVLCVRRKFDEIRREVDQGWWPLCFLSLLFLIFISYLTLTAQTDQYKDADIFSFCLVMLVMLAGYGVIFHTIRYMREAAAAGRMEQSQKILMQKLALMESAAEEAGRMRHDIRHHMLNIAEYARAGDNEALLAYLDDYMRETAGVQQVRLCDDRAINHVLSVYQHRAGQEGIEADFAADVEGGTGIGEVDLVAVLANLLENAVHGCLVSGQEEKKIRVRIRLRAGRLSILVENTCAREIRVENGSMGLRKQGGTGIASILKSVEKYGGDADFKGEGGLFVSRIVLPGRS